MAKYIWPAKWDSMYTLDDPENDKNTKFHGCAEPIYEVDHGTESFFEHDLELCFQSENGTEFMKVRVQQEVPYQHMWWEILLHQP